jgi:hypothetical protein
VSGQRPKNVLALFNWERIPKPEEGNPKQWEANSKESEGKSKDYLSPE